MLYLALLHLKYSLNELLLLIMVLGLLMEQTVLVQQLVHDELVVIMVELVELVNLLVQVLMELPLQVLRIHSLL